MRTGILSDVIRIMEIIGRKMTDFQKIGVLMFDEMHVKSVLEYDTGYDEVIYFPDLWQTCSKRVFLY